MSMAGDGSISSVVVVARTSSLMEADLIRAALDGAGIAATVPGEYAANTLSHLVGGLHPKGIEVLVSTDVAARAGDVVAEWYDRRKSSAKVDLSPDAWARRAWHAAWLQLATLVMIPVAVYCIVKAKRAARETEPEDASRYRRDLRRATTLVTLVALVMALVFMVCLILLVSSHVHSLLYALHSFLNGLLTPLW